MNMMKKDVNNIERLIEEFCPEGVELREINDVALISGAGVDKKTRGNEKPIKLLNYMDVYRNRYIDMSVPKMEVTASINKIEQCNVLMGDIFITPTSEILNDIGNSAVAIDDLNGVVYSYHILRIRLKDQNLISSMFISYVLSSEYVQSQINRKAKGITRFGLTKKQWEKIVIPVPPLAVQEEIVNILDTFTALEAELETELDAELEVRKKQYEYYREELLTFGEEVDWKTLGECVTKNIGGGTPSRANSRYWNGDIPWASVGDLTLEGINMDATRNQITEEGLRNSSTHIVPKNSVIVAVKILPGKMKIAGRDIAINQDLRGLILHDFLFNKFLTYYSQTISILGNGTIVKGITIDLLNKIKIPIPPLEEQKRIVAILDKFDTLVNDISIGLPAELKSRRKQYEYYRNKLLTFKPLKKDHAG